ncbi:hypothetical protein H9P43_007939 [Blastocladiella emersonii ATCC 22665]|nr:hypothetical protein H9P43_007939 [Blastocladiella emersonii ATCC 22665]
MEWVLTTCILWGCTTPLIRRGALGVDAVAHKGRVAELAWLATSWRYVLPLALNLCGSLAFVRALQYADLAVVSPLTNSLTLAMTWVTGWLMGENLGDPVSLAGVALVGAGSYLCITAS